MADTLLEVRQGSPHKMRKALLSLLVIACGGIGGLGFLSGLTLVEGPDEVSAARRVDVVVGVLVGIAACGALHLLQFPRSRRKRVWSSIIVAIAVSAAVGGSLYAWQWSAMVSGSGMRKKLRNKPPERRGNVSPPSELHRTPKRLWGIMSRPHPFLSLLSCAWKPTATTSAGRITRSHRQPERKVDVEHGEAGVSAHAINEQWRFPLRVSPASSRQKRVRRIAVDAVAWFGNTGRGD